MINYSITVNQKNLNKQNPCT